MRGNCHYCNAPATIGYDDRPSSLCCDQCYVLYLSNGSASDLAADISRGQYDDPEKLRRCLAFELKRTTPRKVLVTALQRRIRKLERAAP